MVWFLSCSHCDKAPPASSAPVTTQAKGIFLSGDSLPQPVLIPAGKALRLKADSPHHTQARSQADDAWQKKTVACGPPGIRAPGSDSCQLPAVVTASGQTVVAGRPDRIAAGDAAVKDQDPGNFSFFKILQGLNHNSVRCLMTDKAGNLWFGTNGGGASCYDGSSFSHFTEKQGLCHNVVVSILEDKQGAIWFGTSGGGVSRYDGKSFTHFDAGSGLGSNFVYSMLQDPHGNIWFGTYGGGAVRYNGSSFTRFTQKQGLADNDVYTMFADRKGNIWFGTKNRGVSCYDGKVFRNFTANEGLAGNRILSIGEDSDGRLWFGTNGDGLSCYDGKSFTNFIQTERFSCNIITSIFTDNSGKLWFGTYGGGLAAYTGDGPGADDEKSLFIRYTERDGLSNNWIYGISEDKSGGLWLATYGGGICYYGGKSFRHFIEPEGLGTGAVNSMLEDKHGRLWFGTNGDGLSCYDGKRFGRFTRKEGLPNNVVLSLAEDKSGNIWCGTNGSGVFCFDGRGFSHIGSAEDIGQAVVSSILEDRHGNMWFGTYGAGAFRYDGKVLTQFTQEEGLSDDYILCLLEDRKGNLWFGTDGKGVCCYHAQDGGGKSGFTRFTEKEGLNGNTVNDILEDAHGKLWFGTEDGGLSRFDGNTFIHFTEREGLGNSAVQTLLQDNEGAIWLGTKNGISKLSAKHLSELNAYAMKHSGINPLKEGFFYHFGPHDGFLGVYCRRGSVLQDSKGYIWWGSDILSRYNPKGYQADSSKPVAGLRGIRLFNEEPNWTAFQRGGDTVLGNGIRLQGLAFDSLSAWDHLPLHLSLPYNINHISFHFKAMHLQSHRHILYQYQLEGMDPYPSSVSSRSEASYGNLPGGRYVLKLKAMNQSGVWSEPFLFAFEVRLPWWETAWFRVSVLSLLIVLVIGFYYWRTASLRRNNIRLQQRVKARTREVIMEKRIVEKQKQIIEEKHQEIRDSINYAERIQRALLAGKNLLDDHLTAKGSGNRDYFIFFRPRDVVSGDFYHAARLNNDHFLITTADSTGHGVPGAIMSILNMSCLDKAIAKGFTSPELILNETRKLVIESLRNDGSPEGGRDGMDGSMLSFDFKNQLMHFSGAYNHVWVIRQHQVIELKANRFPVGKHDKDQTPFSLFTLQLQKQDMIYCFTDGFPDQFGGPNGKKFKHKQLQQLLQYISPLPPNIQKQRLGEAFDSWKGDHDQVDDVTIIGIRI